MNSEEIKNHAIEFADWKEEYMRWYNRWLKREYEKAGGIFTSIGPTTSEIYDKWINRIPLSFDEAMEQLNNDAIITTDYWHAIHQITFRLIDGKPHIYHDVDGYKGLKNPWVFNNDQKQNKYWKIVKDGETWHP